MTSQLYALDHPGPFQPSAFLVCARCLGSAGVRVPARSTTCELQTRMTGLHRLATFLVDPDMSAARTAGRIEVRFFPASTTGTRGMLVSTPTRMRIRQCSDLRSVG